MFDTYSYDRLPLKTSDYHAFRAEFRNEDDSYLNYVLSNGFDDGDLWTPTPKMVSTKSETLSQKSEQVA